MPKVNKDIRSFPNAFGLSFWYFFTYILCIGGGIFIFLLEATTLKVIVFVVLAIGLYFLFHSLSRKNLRELISPGEEITGEVDTIDAL